MTQHLHHLVSTKVTAGVFNSPYNPLGPVTVEGKPVEEHIRQGVSKALRAEGYVKKGLVADANGSRKIPLKLAKSRLSVQASSTYDAVQEEVPHFAEMCGVVVRRRFPHTSSLTRSNIGHRSG